MVASLLVFPLLLQAGQETEALFLPKSRFHTLRQSLDFGAENKVFDQAIDYIYREVTKPAYDLVPGMSYEEIAVKLRSLVESTEAILVRDYKTKVSPTGDQWLKAEACSAWPAVHVRYNTDITDAIGRGEKGPTTDTVSLAAPSVTLSTNPPRAVCSGYSVLTRSLARKLGLNCNVLQGHFRDWNWRKGQALGGHCWIEFIFPGDIHVPSDATLAAGNARQLIAQMNGKHCGSNVLPRTNLEWELFFAKHYNWSPIPKNITTYDDKRESTPLLNMSEDEWLTVPISQLEPLERQRLRRAIK